MTKRDESDFRFQMQDMKKKRGPRFQVLGPRVMDAPKPRVRQIASGFGTMEMEICYHGKLTKYFCALCEFEVPRLR